MALHNGSGLASIDLALVRPHARHSRIATRSIVAMEAPFEARSRRAKNESHCRVWMVFALARLCALSRASSQRARHRCDHVARPVTRVSTGVTRTWKTPPIDQARDSFRI